MALNFEKYAASGNLILKEIAVELNKPGDKDVAGKLLRGVLHTLRDVIPMEESLQLIAQLPMILKGIYVDGWTPQKKHEKIKTVNEFVERAFQLSVIPPDLRFPNLETDEDVIRAVLRVLRRHISSGEIADIQSGMPKKLVEIWDEPVWLF